MLKKIASGAAITAIAVGGLLAAGGQAFADTGAADWTPPSDGVDLAGAPAA